MVGIVIILTILIVDIFIICIIQDELSCQCLRYKVCVKVVEELVYCLWFAEILDMVLMSGTLGQDIHLTSSTINVGRVVGNQPSDSIALVDVLNL